MLEQELTTAPPTDMPERSPFGWIEALLAIGVFLLIAWLASMLVGYLQAAHYGATHPWATPDDARAALQNSPTRVVIATILGQLAFLGYLRWRAWTRARPRGWSALGLRFDFPEVGLLIAPALALAPIVVSILVIYLSTLLGSPLPQPQNAPITRLVQNARPYDIALLFVLGVGIAPVVEELLFRGLIYGACRRYTSTGFSIVVVSLLFVSAHYVQTAGYWPSMVAIFLVALVLTTQRAAFGSVVPGWMTHA